MNQKTSNEMLRQLGGNRFIAMTGAKNFVESKDEKNNIVLSFKIGQNSKKINYVKMTLNGLDLYNLEFLSISNGIKKGFQKKVISSVENIYCDQLKETFERNTGLYTSL